MRAAKADDRRVKKSLGVIGLLVLLSGACGVLRELTDGWFRFMGFTRFLTENVGFLQGRELFANAVIAGVASRC